MNFKKFFRQKFDQVSALNQLRNNANWYLVMGILLVIVGFFATIFAYSSTLFSVIYLGFFLIIRGIIELVQSFKLTKWGNFLLHIGLGILFVLGGFYIVTYPEINALNLTLVLAMFFVIAGLLQIIFALTHYVYNKIWMLIGGALTLLLGVLIWQQWPISGLWAIGTLVGIELIITGFTWVSLALKVKKHLPK